MRLIITIQTHSLFQYTRTRKLKIAVTISFAVSQNYWSISMDNSNQLCFRWRSGTKLPLRQSSIAIRIPKDDHSRMCVHRILINAQSSFNSARILCMCQIRDRCVGFASNGCHSSDGQFEWDQCCATPVCMRGIWSSVAQRAARRSNGRHKRNSTRDRNGTQHQVHQMILRCDTTPIVRYDQQRRMAKCCGFSDCFFVWNGQFMCMCMFLCGTQCVSVHFVWMCVVWGCLRSVLDVVRFVKRMALATTQSHSCLLCLQLSFCCIVTATTAHGQLIERNMPPAAGHKYIQSNERTQRQNKIFNVHSRKCDHSYSLRFVFVFFGCVSRATH